MTRWAIITGEYPPQPGGVSDYTQLVVTELTAAGDMVKVLAPRPLLALDRALADRPDRILIQYVPHAFGWKGLNVPFAVWVATRARHVAPVWVMFHEVLFPARRWPPAHVALGCATRVMARLVAGAAERVFVSIPAWGELLRSVCPRAVRAEWLPVPSSVGVAPTAARLPFPTGGEVVGHFGTFGGMIAAMLEPAARDLLRARTTAHVLLVGRGSESFRARFAAAYPDLAARTAATGGLPPDEVAAHLRACDVLLQPYPDGISSRRTSAMAGLANSVPVVSNLGPLSEPLWPAALRVTPTPDPAALAALVRVVLDLPPAERHVLGARGRELYRTTFDIAHTIARLRCPCEPA